MKISGMQIVAKVVLLSRRFARNSKICVTTKQIKFRMKMLVLDV